MPNETELFEERLQTANEEIRQDVELLIENHPDAIIVVSGDHGPYLTKGCYITGDEYDISEITRQDIQDRFGTFLAIRWPDDGFDKYDDIVVLQDLFPAIFAYLFEDAKILDSRIDPRTFQAERVSGARVEDGVIQGGVHDGGPLFLGNQ